MSDLLANAGVVLNLGEGMSERILELKDRVKRCVCRFCGGELSLHKITYAAYDEAKIDIFCDNCNRIEFGVEPEVYKIAEYYVDVLQYDQYPELDNSERKRRMNIAVICDILTWGYNKAGFLDKNGFTVELNYSPELLDAALLITDTELSNNEKR